MMPTRRDRIPRPGSLRDRYRDELAQRYAMGLLLPATHRAFEDWLEQDAQLQAQVHGWEHLLAQLQWATPHMQPSAGCWRQIESRVAEAKRAVAMHAKHPKQRSWFALLGRTPRPGNPPRPRRPTAGPAMGLSWSLVSALLVAGLVMLAWLGTRGVPSGTASPAAFASIPASYVGVLTDQMDRPALVVASLRHSRVVQLKQQQALPVEPGQTAVLWALSPSRPPQAIARLRNQSRSDITLREPAEQTFAQVDRLAVSIESESSDLPQRPLGPFIWQGHCAKVW